MSINFTTYIEKSVYGEATQGSLRMMWALGHFLFTSNDTFVSGDSWCCIKGIIFDKYSSAVSITLRHNTMIQATANDDHPAN